MTRDECLPMIVACLVSMHACDEGAIELSLRDVAELNPHAIVEVFGGLLGIANSAIELHCADRGYAYHDFVQHLALPGPR